MRARRRRLIIAALGLGLALLIAGLASREPLAAPAPPVAMEVPQSAETPVVLPDQPMTPPAQPAPEPDGGPAVGLDASAGDGGDPRIEETMRRWREALAPLFKSGGYSRKPPTVISVVAEARAPEAPPTACGEAALTFSLESRAMLDLLVVIDTSGSMESELPEVVRWLAEVEVTLRDQGTDFQFIVVADQRAARWRAVIKKRTDAGLVPEPVGSRDALETLIRSAGTSGPTAWPALLRSGAAKHLVIVTDDEALDPAGLNYLPPLIEAAGGALGSVEQPGFALHLLGGFKQVSRAPLGAEDPLATETCFGGVAPGLAYQRLAQRTGGLRASLCVLEAMRGLGAQLSAEQGLHRTACLWLLPAEVAAALDTVVARQGSRVVQRLLRARAAEACFRRDDAWVLEGRFLALCKDTCAALEREHADRVELSTLCSPPARP